MKTLFVLVILAVAVWFLFGDQLNINKVRNAGSLKPKDSDFPAAGVCDFQPGETVTVILHEDVPAPRCLKVRSNQILKVENDTERNVKIWFDNVPKTTLPVSSVNLMRDSKYIFGKPFGEYLEPGVHILKNDLYNGSGPEIWFVK